MKGFIFRHGILLFALTVLPVFFLLGSASPFAGSYPFYYFNPDSSHSNLSKLKQTMDRLLDEGKTPVAFQPFVHQSDLDKIYIEKRPAFLFVPEWYFRAYGKEKGLRPLLLPIQKSSTSYRKVFLASSTGSGDLSRCSVAITNMGPKPDQTLNGLGFLKKGLDASKLNLVTVPKDLDALFALALGQVDAALVSRENIDLVVNLNPNIKNTMREIFVSDMIPLPILCYVEGATSPEELNRFKELFLGAQFGKIRQQVMELLHIDAWKEPAN